MKSDREKLCTQQDSAQSILASLYRADILPMEQQAVLLAQMTASIYGLEIQVALLVQETGFICG